MNLEAMSPAINNEVPIGAFPDPSVDFRAHLLEHLYDGVYYVGRDRRIRYWNRSAQRITGYSAADVCGQRCSVSSLAHHDSSGQPMCGRNCPLSHALNRGVPTSERISLQCRDGERITVDLHATPIRDSEGRIIGALQIFRDATPAVELEAAYHELSRLAERDALTGLLNRRAFLEALDHQLVLHRQTGVVFCAIFADLDHFKSINDTWGHAAGDRILTLVAARLAETCRSRDVLARYGGEEFVILLPDCELAQAVHLTERLREALSSSKPRFLTGRGLTASFGLAEVRDYDSSDTLLARADQALYRAKEGGRDRVETDLASGPFDHEHEPLLVLSPAFRGNLNRESRDAATGGCASRNPASLKANFSAGFLPDC